MPDFTAEERPVGKTYGLTTFVGVMLSAHHCALLTAVSCSCRVRLSANPCALLIAKSCCCCGVDSEHHPWSSNDKNELLLYMTMHGLGENKLLWQSAQSLHSSDQAGTKPYLRLTAGLKHVACI